MDLTLKEKFVTLAYNPEKGNSIIPSYIGYGIAGAMLLELAGMKKINIEENRVRLLDNKKTGDDQLDYMIGILDRSAKPLKARRVIGKIQGKASKIKTPIIQGLIKKRYLQEKQKRFLIFSYKRFPSLNYGYRKDLVEHIRRLVLRKIESDKDIPLLAGLAGACRLSPKFFRNGEEKKIARRRIKEIVKESEIDKAIDETIKAVQAAVMISIATTSAATSGS